MRLLFTSCVLSLLTITVSAQRFKGELQAGITASQVSGDELQGFDKAGLIFGGGVRAPINEKFSFGLRMLYVQKGSRKPSDLEKGDPIYYLLRLNYLEMPIQFRYISNKKAYFELGPSVGYLIKIHEEDENGELTERDPFNKFDLSISGAIGYPIGKNWDFQFTFWQSILPIREHAGGATYRLNKGQYNSVVSLNFLFNIEPGNNKN